MPGELKKSWKKTHAWSKLFILLLIISALSITVIFIQNQQDIRQRASETSGAALTLSPTTANIAPGATVTSDLGLAAGSNQISGVDITVTFDKNILEIISFTPTDVLNNQLINTIDNVAGTLRYSAVDTVTSPPTGSSTLGTITFKAKNAGNSTVNFQNIQITAINSTAALPTTGNVTATYTVAVPATPTPLATATPIPPTPTPVAGDVNGDSAVNILDFNIWRSEFLKITSTLKADLNNDGKIDLLDFNIWRNAFGSASATPTPIPAKKVFITSTTYNGNLGGLSGADAKCQARATAADLGGNWKAWLSDNTTSASSRLTHSTLPYKLINGSTIANNWSDLIDGTLQNPINITETGSFQGNYVYSGTNSNGEIMNPGTSKCADWTVSNVANGPGLLGHSGYTDYRWSWGTSYSCANQYPLYCIEQ